MGDVDGSRSLGSVTVESVFPRLEPLLPRVRKPVQYVGGELHATVKDWDTAAVRWALMYPDAYEVGLPNQGVQILYEVLNERDDVLAERTYSVWPDLEALMREHEIPQFTVDAHRPVGDFDLLGVSFSTELGYTNLLTALDLAGIPLSAADRRDGDPIVIAGGHAAFNPEPIAEFIDAAVARRRRAGGAGDHRPGPRLEGRGRAGRPRRSAARARDQRRRLRPGVLRRDLPAGRPDPARRTQPARRAVAGRPSTPSWTSTRGRTRSSRWCRWPRPCTSATASRSSAAARAAAGSARPG